MYYNRQYLYQEQVTEAMQLISSSANLEAAAAKYYDWLVDNIPVEGLTRSQRTEIADILMTIRDDEIKHNEMFMQIYRDFTGKEVEITEKDFVPPQNFLDGLKTALFEEFNSVRRYREIMHKIPGDEYKAMLFDIISDELIHGHLFEYIYSTVLNSVQESRSRKK